MAAMPNTNIPLQMQQVDVVNPLLMLQQGRRQQQQDAAAAEQQQYQRGRQERMDALTIADLGQQRELRGEQIAGQRTQNTAANLDLQREALKVIARDGIAQDDLIQKGDVQSAAILGQEIKRTMTQAGIPTDKYDEFLAKFNGPLFDLKAESAQNRKRLEPMLGQIFQDQRDAQGNLVGQRNSETGQLTGVPSGMGAPSQADALNLQNQQLQNQRLQAQIAQDAQNAAAAEAKRQQEAQAATQQQQGAQNSLLAQVDTVTGMIRQAVDLSGTTQSGWTGSAMSAVSPAGDNSKYRRVLDAIKANVGFDKLMEMKRSSPTGGALGSVTEKELAFLQSTLGTMDPRASDAEIKQVLGQVYDVYDRINQSAGGPPLPPLEGLDQSQPRGVSNGMTATNPETGERRIYRNGAWVPL